MLNLPDTLTQEVAHSCLDTLRSGLSAEPQTIVVDGASLQRFDSSALAVLLELRRECARVGKQFAVQGLPKRLRDLAALYGIEGLLTAA
ncbi:STAS domain-containing protein [uncultured Rhodoferax sp.]|uniref:STAS domain-containing protein n=1 Tax=uncultured Rhodoferax sp. TaxID=223188 RepID=UPI0025DA4547|nr:STAS domain-containing protein [uncultured Rhodoferax sp.]